MIGRLVAAAVMIAIGTTSALAAPTHPVQLAELISQADVIAGGVVSAVNRNAGAPVVSIRLDYLYKGAETRQTVNCSIAETAFLSAGHRLAPLSYRLFFLRRQGDQYVFADPTYPSLPAMAANPSSGNTATQQVVAILHSVIDAAGAEREQKVESVDALRGLQDPDATQALRAAFTKTDPPLKHAAAAALLAHGDMTPLQDTTDALLKGSDADSAPALRQAISQGVRDPAAIPVLQALAKSQKVEDRRAAVAALRHMRSNAAVPGMVSALKDDDILVKYEAVIGLAELTGTTSEGPSIPLFRQHPEQYVTYWQNWAAHR